MRWLIRERRRLGVEALTVGIPVAAVLFAYQEPGFALWSGLAASLLLPVRLRWPRIAVLLCVPAPVARSLHANPLDEEADYLTTCTFSSALKVSCLLDAPLAPEGKTRPYLLLTPEVEDRVLSAIIFDHEKHPGRAPTARPGAAPRACRARRAARRCAPSPPGPWPRTR